jgi:hypothetical protein
LGFGAIINGKGGSVVGRDWYLTEEIVVSKESRL